MLPAPRQPDPVEEIIDLPPAVSIRVRTARPSPAIPGLVVIVAGFLALAIVKPWGGTAAPAPRPSASAAVVAAASEPAGGGEPTPVVDREAAVAEECHAPSGWRIVTSETWQDREVRIWWAVTPVASRSAFDPAIPYLSIVSDAIHQLGYCAPLFAPERPGANEAVGVWRIDPVAETAEAINPTRVSPAFDSALVSIWAPPGSAAVGEASWPTGRYVFGVGGRWFGVDLRILDRGAGPSPAPGPGASSPANPPGSAAPGGSLATPTSRDLGDELAPADRP